MYRQYIYKKKKAIERKEDLTKNIVKQVQNARKKHKNMGSRVLFYYLKINELGINGFENIVSKNNLGVYKKKKRIVTTSGVYDENDENLINGLKINNINQVISGDITYFILKDKLYYIYTLKDMYSKRIIGLYGNDNLKASNAIIVLKQAIRLRGKALKGCIHHTDAGSQYKSTLYKRLMNKKEMKRSIAENCLENGMAEQLNGIIKNDYLTNEIKSKHDLNRKLKEIKRLLNEERPIEALGYKTPVEFENALKNEQEVNNNIIELYDFTKEKGGL